MALVTLDGGQSSVTLNGISTSFLVNKALIELPGAPDTLVQSVLQDVLREFYTISGGWREVIGPFWLRANVTTIYLNPVDQFSQLQTVLAAWLYPSVVGGNSRQFLTPNSRMVQGTDKAATPATYWMTQPDVMNVYPIPDGSFTQPCLYVYGTILPLINTTRLPQIAVTHHFTGLIAGILARMYRMPKKPWSDKDAAAEQQKIYIQERRRARQFANQGFSIGESPWRFPHFAGRGIHGSAPIAADH